MKLLLRAIEFLTAGQPQKHPWFLMSCGIVIFCGCAESTSSVPKNEFLEPESQPIAQTVDVQQTDGAQFETLLTKHEGQVVLVDFWATWCPPCIKHFPHTVVLANKYRDDGLAVISMSFDDPEDEASVRQFLESNKAMFDNRISQFGSGNESLEAFDIDGGLPQYRLYDRAGKLRYRFPTAPDSLEQDVAKTIENRIVELLGEQ